MMRSLAACKFLGNGAKLMGVKLCKKGKEHMDTQRKKQGFRKYDEKWWTSAHVSESTLKRFWAGTEICPESFRAICEAVDVDLAKEWDLLIEGDKKDSTRVENLKELKDIYTFNSEVSIKKFKITLRGVGVFDERTTQLVRQSLDDLKDFLSASYVQFPASPIHLDLPKTKFTINVNGFGILDENHLLIVQDILRELEYLLITIHVKMMPI